MTGWKKLRPDVFAKDSLRVVGWEALAPDGRWSGRVRWSLYRFVSGTGSTLLVAGFNTAADAQSAGDALLTEEEAAQARQTPSHINEEAATRGRAGASLKRTSRGRA